VQGLMVGPTPNPELSFLSSKMRFSKKDLPVRYLPATAITPTRSFTLLSKAAASSLTEKPKEVMLI